MTIFFLTKKSQYIVKKGSGYSVKIQLLQQEKNGGSIYKEKVVSPYQCPTLRQHSRICTFQILLYCIFEFVSKSNTRTCIYVTQNHRLSQKGLKQVIVPNNKSFKIRLPLSKPNPSNAGKIWKENVSSLFLPLPFLSFSILPPSLPFLLLSPSFPPLPFPP